MDDHEFSLQSPLHFEKRGLETETNKGTIVKHKFLLFVHGFVVYLSSLGFLPGKDCQTHRPNIPRSPPNQSLSIFSVLTPKKACQKHKELTQERCAFYFSIRCLLLLKFPNRFPLFCLDVLIGPCRGCNAGPSLHDLSLPSALAAHLTCAALKCGGQLSVRSNPEHLF